MILILVKEASVSSNFWTIILQAALRLPLLYTISTAAILNIVLACPEVYKKRMLSLTACLVTKVLDMFEELKNRPVGLVAPKASPDTANGLSSGARVIRVLNFVLHMYCLSFALLVSG